MKTFVRWPVLFFAELLSFTVRLSFDFRAVKNGFSFENNGKTKRTLDYIFPDRQNHNRAVEGIGTWK